jgi:hypothetical protein
MAVDLKSNEKGVGYTCLSILRRQPGQHPSSGLKLGRYATGGFSLHRLIISSSALRHSTERRGSSRNSEVANQFRRESKRRIRLK